MKQYRQHRQTNEQTRTTEYIAPVCNTYLQHRQTDRQSDTDNGYTCKYDIVIRLVTEHDMLSMSCLFLDMGILQ